MKKLMLTTAAFIFCIMPHLTYSSTCPNPATSSLQWGAIPSPWQLDPFSDHTPQGDKNTRFVRANILVAGIGQGVVCNYQNSIGYYSIWWPVSVKIPARVDYDWLESMMGYACTISPEECVFYTPQQ